MLKRATAILKLLMAKLLTQDLTCLPSALLGRREKHLEWSVTTMLDRLTYFNWGEGVVDFKMYNNQVERLVNNLTGRYLPGRAWKVIKRTIVQRYPVLGTSFNCITSSITLSHAYLENISNMEQQIFHSWTPSLTA